MGRQAVTYLMVIDKTVGWVKKNPGVDRSRLNKWLQSVFGIKSRKAGELIDKLVYDDYLRVAVHVQPEGVPEKIRRGRKRTRYVATKR